jgi:hypothetical protein
MNCMRFVFKPLDDLLHIISINYKFILNMKNIRLILKYGITISIILLFLSNCKSTKETSTKSNHSNFFTEDFSKFYNRFHTDYSFQISRIKFPLQGVKVDGFETKNWSRKNWSMMKIKIYDIDTTWYKVNYKKTDNSFTQKFWVQDTGFSSEYRFELIKNKWYLVYALDKNL